MGDSGSMMSAMLQEGRGHEDSLATDLSVATVSLDDDDHGRLQYKPLPVEGQHLRLLIIRSGKQTDRLDCSLQHASLAQGQQPVYETISYCWGDASKRDSITVDGITVSVPASSAAALQRVRLPDRERIVWLDAICINQQDTNERSRQVLLMGSIYRSGVANLIYLGEEGITTAALDSVRSILRTTELEKDYFKRLRNDAGSWQYADTRSHAEYDVKALMELFSIPWLRRMWVLQEAALAKTNTCFCGPMEIDLVDITRTAAWLVYNYYFVEPDLRLQCSYAADLNDLVDQQYGYYNTKSGRPAGILYLLDLAQQRLCSVSSDKVYGILGLAVDGKGVPQLNVTPDYKKDVAEVYCEAAWAMIRQDSDLQVLDYVRHRTRGDGSLELDGFASWVPKWHQEKDTEEYPNFMSMSFDAAGGRKAVLDPSCATGTGTVLTVGGLHLVVVRHTTHRIRRLANPKTKHLQADLQSIDDTFAKCNTRAAATALARAICAGVNARYEPAGTELEQGYKACKLLGSADDPVPQVSDLDTDGINESTKAAGLVAEAMYNACSNRKFFVASDGVFGLGPHFMTEGDVVAVLYGLRWPVVLRPVGVEYLFLGTAYVEGYMQGEAIKMDRDDEKTMMFSLR